MALKITFDDITLSLDLTINEKHNRSGDSTDHVLEGGSVISDHQILSPDTFSIKGFLSEIPFKGVDDPQILIFNELDEARKNKKLFTVETILKTYENVVLKELSGEFNEDHGGSMLLDLTFKQNTFVKAEETKAPKENIGKPQNNNTVKQQQDRFSTNKNKGQIGKTKPTAAQQTKLDNSKKAVSNPNAATKQSKSFLSNLLGY